MSKHNSSSPRGLLSDDYTSRSVRYPLITSEFENLLGQVLTIIDASISNEIQNKSIKDLIRQRFGDKMHNVFWDICYRKEFHWANDTFYAENIIDGTARYSEQVKGGGTTTTVSQG